MPLDQSQPRLQRSHRGRRNYQAGTMAEDSAARLYEERGATLRDKRWRGAGGEIDLIAQTPEGVIFIEVKQSQTFERAAESLGPRQIARLCNAAAEYLGTLPLGQLTPMRFDLALVNGQGEVRVIENAITA